jgi:hypothetical protein
MKIENYTIKLLFLLQLIFCCIIDLSSQEISDSLIRITKTNTLLISNPAPKYIVEINNDTSISFYNNLPENFSKNHPRIEGWIIDSTSVKFSKTEFTDLLEKINTIDFENIRKQEILNSNNGVEKIVSGGYNEKYTIELINQYFEFYIDSNNESYISESILELRKLIQDLEEKYKPEK